MKSFIKFNLGVLKSPIRVQLWMMLLLAANLVAPLFFLGHIEARAALLALGLSMALMTWLTALTGFSRAIGAGHVFWLPLIGWLWSRLDQIPPDGALGIWIRALILVNTVSLVIDVAEVIRYAKGDRQEVVEGLPG